MLNIERNSPALFSALLATAVDAYRQSLPRKWTRGARAAVMTSDGVVIAATDPFEAASVGAITGSIRSFFGQDWHSGDIALTNDVYNGASHPTEFTAITPLDFGRGYNAIRGWLAMRADFPDVGGWDLGGYTLRALDIWSEGVRITPVKLARQGKIRDEVVQILGLNSRTPRLTDACARAIFQSFQAALSSDYLLTMKSEFEGGLR